MKVMSQVGQVNLNNPVKTSELFKESDSVKNVKTNDNNLSVDIQNKDVENEKCKSDGNSINKKELEKALQKLNGFLSDEKAHASLSYHDKTNRLMVTVYDKDDNVVMEIPSKKVLDMIAKMSDLLGVSVDKKA